MPGQTNNPNILSAENQEIVAINEVVTAIENLTIPPVQVQVTVNTTALETAIAGLQTALVSTLDAMQVVVRNLNFCCATTPPAPPGPGTPGGGSPGDPPGPGQEEPPGTIEEKASRRCKIAMWLIDDYLGGIVEWGDTSGFDTVINHAVNSGFGLALTVIGGFAASIVATVLSQFVTPGPDPTDPFIILIGAAIGAYIAHALVNGGEIDFASLVTFIDDNRVTMICALSNSQNALSAHNALVAAIDDISPGLSPGNRNFVSSFLGTASLALLFFVDERFGVLEDWIAEQPDTCPCEDDADPETGTPTNTYKCKAANYLFDNFTSSLVGWGTIASMTWYSAPAIITALASGLLETLLGDLYRLIFTGGLAGWAQFVAKLVSKLGQLYWVGSDYFNAFALIAAEFELRKEDIICEFYLAEDVETVRTEITNRLNDYVGTVMTAHPEWDDQIDAYKDAIKDLLSNSALNVLFEETPRPEITNYAPEDFIECTCGIEPPELVCWTFDTDLQGWFVEFEGGGDVSINWSSPGNLTQTNVGNLSDYPKITSPEISYTVLAGDQVKFCFDGSYFFGFSLWVTIGGVDVLVATIGNLTATGYVYVLNDHIGETITRVKVGVNKAGGGTWNFTAIGINCPC